MKRLILLGALFLMAIPVYAQDPERALRLFEEFPGQVLSNRGFYQEWGTSAGACRLFEDNVVLLAFSLADPSGQRVVENDQAKLGLAGLGVALGRLFEQTRDPAFLQGLAAVAVLGRQLHLDPTTAGYFRRYSEEATAQGVSTPTVVQALSWFRDAISAASHSAISRTVSDRVGETERLAYAGLQRLFRP